MFSIIIFLKSCVPCINSAVLTRMCWALNLPVICFSPEEKHCHLQTQCPVFIKSKLVFPSEKSQKDDGLENKLGFIFFINYI